MSIPAHKVIGDEGKPGQLKEVTLGDYLKNKGYVSDKLTFEDWWSRVGVWSYGNYMEKQQAEGVWIVAQENK